MSTTVAATLDKLNTLNTAIQMVASTAATAQQLVGTAPTNAQKLQAAVAIASAFDPQVAQLSIPLELLISNMVSLFNIFGIFTHTTNPTATPAGTPVPAQVVDSAQFMSQTTA
jgi:hypothetical protein